MNAIAQRWRIGGRVQGVGYRPFVYRIARLNDLTGWVRNNGGEVEIHAQGYPARLRMFGETLLGHAPPAALARVLGVRLVPAEALGEFRILESTLGVRLHAQVPVDLFTCDDCLAELRDPAARRHRYPFINCTQCGPRYTIIRRLPYDRRNTTLDAFKMCCLCETEYRNPQDRRFHAQPLACAVCGPVLSWSSPGQSLTGNEISLDAALSFLRSGRIVGVRGVGGYHLLCDAANETAVALLRTRKQRPTKPLALMVPWRGPDGLEYARSLAQMSLLEAAALLGPTRPIVLTRRRFPESIALSVAPGLAELGIMLPYSPLHHLLLEGFGAAVVATSGNLSAEPVLTDPVVAQAQLTAVVDGFLHHNRGIVRPADDPVVRLNAGAMRPIRLGRGTAPLELKLPRPIDVPTLAVGSYMKNTVALGWDNRAIVSPHIGDLESVRAREVFAQVADDLQQLYGVRAERVVHDGHPSFSNTRWARESGLPAIAVWHHHAHAAAVAGEFASDEPLLCFTWDGIGVGPDNSLWGGEGLLGRPGAWRRAASFRTFRLPGGERAARQPWRSALGLCWECDAQWPAGNQFAAPLLRQAFDKHINAPLTTAVGRLFDGAAALIGVCLHASYEGEGPIGLEALCECVVEPMVLPLSRDTAGVWRSDWRPLVPAMLDAKRNPALRAALFHSTLAQALCEQALAVRNDTGVQSVGLSGGVFQNRVLTEQVQTRLMRAGFKVLIPQRLPVNDAAISFGQLIEAAAAREA